MSTEIKNTIELLAHVFDAWYALEEISQTAAAEDNKKLYEIIDAAQASLDASIVALAQDIVKSYNTENDIND